jgi:very-short-patch-repair endonuclease
VPLGGRYIADFVAQAAGLVVEVDGAAHVGRRSADARRDRVLRRLGYRVLRLPARLVMRDPQAALARVRVALASDG